MVTGPFMDEMAKLPDKVLNQSVRTRMVLEERYTKIIAGDPLMHNVIRTDLTSGLGRLLSSQQVLGVGVSQLTRRQQD